MKTVNAPKGYDLVPAQQEKRTWYRWHKFPLVPIFSYRPRDEWNGRDFSFSWLFLRLWTLSHFFQFKAEICLDDNGLALGVILPYLRVWVWILPLPDLLGNKIYSSRFYRKGKRDELAA